MAALGGDFSELFSGSLSWWRQLYLQHPSSITVHNFLSLPLPSATGKRKGGILLPEGMLATFMTPPKGPW